MKSVFMLLCEISEIALPEGVALALDLSGDEEWDDNEEESEAECHQKAVQEVCKRIFMLKNPFDAHDGQRHKAGAGIDVTGAVDGFLAPGLIKSVHLYAEFCMDDELHDSKE